QAEDGIRARTVTGVQTCALPISAGLINADAELTSRVNKTGTLAKNSSNLANAGLGLAVGGAGALWFVGRIHADDHQQEAGILARSEERRVGKGGRARM